jgi:hypothetical protein
MVLSDDLRDAGGAVLLPGGTALTEAMLGGLARRGIAALAVVVALPDAEREAERERRCARLVHLFRHSVNAGAGQVLLERLQQYRRSQ